METSPGGEWGVAAVGEEPQILSLTTEVGGGLGAHLRSPEGALSGRESQGSVAWTV